MMVIAIVVFVALLLIVYFFARFFPIGLWISALASGVRIKISALIGMRFRRIVPGDIVRPLIKATKAGLNIDINEMEAHLLAGGRLNVWRLCCIVILLLGVVLMESRQSKGRGYKWLLFACLGIAARILPG